MARSLPERIASGRRPALAASLTMGLRSPLPPLLVALVALVALLAAYSVRPTVRIDLGDYYDSAFLEGFHGREIDATAAGSPLSWPAERNELVLPGKRQGVWIATFEAAAGQPDEALEEVA